MFLTREKNILQLLFTKNGTMTTSEIAAKLNVSTRTIKSDIKRLNTDETLIQNGCSIMTKAGVGYWLVYEQSGENFLKELFEDNAELVSPELRKYLVAWYILKNGDFVSMETIANEMFISKSTVLLTVNELTPLFSRFDLQLNKKAKFGVKADGNESNIRRATAYVLGKIIGKPSKDVIRRLKYFFEDVDLSAIQLIVRNIETKRHVMFADLSFYDVLINIAITSDRVSRGFCCGKEDEIEDLILAGHDLQEAAEISKDIYQELDVKVSSYDLYFLQYNIMSAKTQPTEGEEKSTMMMLKKNEPEFYQYVVEVLEDVGNKNGINLLNDDEILAALLLHLEGARKRAKVSGHIDNPFLETIRSTMVYEYEIAYQVIEKFSEKYPVNTDEHEIGFVALHVGAVLEKEIVKKIYRKQSVVLVCVSGIGIAQFISAKMARLFPNIEIEQVIPLNRLSMYEDNKLKNKIVITMVNIELEDSDVVLVSPAFTQEDIRKIQEVLAKHSDINTDTQNRFPTLMTLLNKEITILQCDLKSKEEVIQLLGTRLINEGYGTKEYISSVFAREEVSDTSIGALVAIPHAIGNPVLKNGIGLMTLKKPISWGFEKVQLILMIAIDAKTGINLQRAFAEVMDMINNPSIISTIIKSKNFSDIIALLGNNQEAKNEVRGKIR